MVLSARLGLAPGQHVRIASRHGSTEAAVDVTDTIRPGVVSLPHAWSTPGVNRLTSATVSAAAIPMHTDDVEALTGMPRLSGIPVDVTAVTGR